MSTAEMKARIGRLILEASTGALGEDCKLLSEAVLTAIGEAENLRAQLPDFQGLPKRKLEDLLAEGFRITGYAIERDGDSPEPRRGFINAGGLVGWWWQNTMAEHDTLRERISTSLTMVEQANQVSTELMRERDALRAQVEALTKGQEPVTWWNGCDKSVPQALRYLAEHERPSGGEARFNSLHLHQLADEIERMAKSSLYAHPAPSPLTRPAVPEGWKLVPDETHRRFLVGPTPWTHTRVPQRLFDMARAVAGTSTAEDDKRVYNVLQATLQILADAPQSEVPQTAVRDIDAAAKALAKAMDYPWEQMPEQGRAQMRKDAEAILEAAAPQPEVCDSNLLGEIVGCFDAAINDGLYKALAESKDARLVDLVNCRLMPAYYAAIGPSKPIEAAQKGGV